MPEGEKQASYRLFLSFFNLLAIYDKICKIILRLAY